MPDHTDQCNRSPYHWDTQYATPEVMPLPHLHDQLAMTAAVEFGDWLNPDEDASWLTRLVYVTLLRLQTQQSD
jgi:hypothetical protein